MSISSTCFAHLAISVVALVLVAPNTSRPLTAQDASPARLRVIGAADATPLALSVDDLKKMPRKTLSVVNPRDKKIEVYEGVSIAELLHLVGVPQGENLRGTAMASYVLAEASDGYRVVFSV